MKSTSDNTAENYAVWGIPGTVIWGIVIIMALVFSQLVGIAIFAAKQHPGVDPTEIESLMPLYLSNGEALAYGAIASLIVCLPLVMGIIKLKNHSSIDRYLGLRIVTARVFVYWTLVTFGCSIAYGVLLYLLGQPMLPDFAIAIYQSGSGSPVFWAGIVFAAPLLEEVIFRGFIFSGLAASILGPVGALLLTSFFWAAMHLQYDYYWLLSIFILGIVLGTARHKSKGSVSID